jgi:hypothetical protein
VRSDIAARRPLTHDVDAFERVNIPSVCISAPLARACRPGARFFAPVRVGRSEKHDGTEKEMAIGLRLKFEGGTQEQYEAVHGHMNVEGDPPEGLIFHMAGPIDEGWGVIDCWKSRHHFDTFFQNRLGPAVAELGDRAPANQPDLKEFEVFNHFTP